MNSRKDLPLDLAAVQQTLDQATGKTYWRSLEELANTPAFEEMLHREFPENATEWAGDEPSRRRFLTLMGASLALAGLAGCTKTPNEKILPYVIQPEGILPTRPQFYASALTLAGQVTGVLVESHMGRPTKIEGNPDHPVSLGATDTFAQAEILTMYDPDREAAVSHLGVPRGWDDAFNEIGAAVDAAGDGGERVRILTETVVSPTLADQFKNLLESKRFAKAKVVVHEPVHATAEAATLKAVFSEDVTPVYHFDKAEVVVSLDSDFLCGPGASLKYANAFSARRRLKPGEGLGKTVDALHRRMNRLYAVEAMISPTGSLADHRLALKPSEVEAFVRALAAKLGVANVKDADKLDKKHEKFLDALVQDLTKTWDEASHSFKESRKAGTTLIVPGPYQSAAVHQLAHAINDKLGNLGQTVTFVEPAEKLPIKPEQSQTVEQLVADMKAGKVDVLLILGGNPVYAMPKATGFADALGKVKLRAHAGLFADETSAQCHWHLPLTHALEQWSDARAFDGTATIVQPLINPLYNGKSYHDILTGFTADPAVSSLDVVRAYWKKWYDANKAGLQDARSKEDFELFWKKSLRDGVIEGTASKAKTPGYKAPDFGGLAAGGEFEILFRPDPALFDGRYANNGWLQEFPKPLTKITWDNVAHMSVATAKALGITQTLGRRGGEHGETYIDKVDIEVPGVGKVNVAAWVVPGHADGSVTLTLGYGRTRAGRVSMSPERGVIGVDVGDLRKTASTWTAPVGKANVVRAGGKHLVACVQAHHSVEGSDLVREATFEAEAHDDHFHWHLKIHGSGHHAGHGNAHDAEHPPEKQEAEAATSATSGRIPLDNILPPIPTPPQAQRWGLVINLGACTGCSACVIACQAENNIPVVGKDQVNKGREMHWLRIDRYYAAEKGQDLDNPNAVETHHQPLPCQQCEKAPCEQVCPVSATVHSDDGLNDMVYNRCVGTRYCSNNCPYKVRRFNFLAYQEWADDSLRLMRNPEVTVRTRGVMEKCTYCVQRVRAAEVEARREAREIRDGEVLTACQAVCAMGAITFGDLGPQGQTPKTDAAKLRASKLNYTILDELNTFPRTSYLAAVRNPNPLLVSHGEKKG